MSGISVARIVSRSGARRPEPSGVEASRIAFLIARDGEDAALDWVRRTLEIYRSAVSDSRHFASLPQYRDLFLDSCASFSSWLYPNS